MFFSQLMAIGNHGKRGANVRARVTPQEPESEFGIATHLCLEEMHTATQKIPTNQKKEKAVLDGVSMFFFIGGLFCIVSPNKNWPYIGVLPSSRYDKKTGSVLTKCSTRVMTLTVQLIRNGEECFPYHNIDIILL